MSMLPTGSTRPTLGVQTHTKSGNSKLIKGKLSAQPTREACIPAYSASGQDVWTSIAEQAGDAVIVSAVGARCGKAFLASGEWSAIANTHIVWPKPDFLNVRLLWYRINDEKFWVKGGSAQPFVKVGSTFELPFSLPPFAEQKRIADKLDTVLARVDAVNERLARVAPLLKRFRQSVLAAATSGRLTVDWRGSTQLQWETLSADKACSKVQSGGTPKAGFSEYGVPFLKVYNIVNQQLAFDYKPQYVTHAVNDSELKKSQVQPGDVLMNIVGPPLGKVAIVTNQHAQWNINQAITLFRPSERLTTEWIYILLCEGAPIRDVLARTKGSVGQVNISLSQCRAFEFVIPPKEEQAEIVRRVETLFAFADRLEARLQAAQTAVDRLTPSLLAKAFRGELVPQDPNDEPAAELLKRLATTTPTVAKRTQRKKSTA